MLCKAYFSAVISQHVLLTRFSLISLKNKDTHVKSEGSDNLLGTVLPDCLSKEGQGDLHPADRRNLPSTFLKALRDPQHRNSNQGDMAGNPPERGNETDKEGGRKKEGERKTQRER